MKRCIRCGRELPLTEFYRHGDRLSSRCKECVKEIERERYKKKPKIKRLNNKQCARCVYRTYIGESEQELACYYLINTGHRRGCPVEGCDKFVEGEALTKVNRGFRL